MDLTVPSMQDLLTAGAHFGHQVRRGHPRMGKYIYGARDGVHIIDLAQTESRLKEAAQAAYDFGKNSKVLLVVGTKKQARDIAMQLATDAGTPYLTARWIGGLLTNFDEIFKNVRKLVELKKEQEKGLLSRYTKKEQLLITRKLMKFTREMGGIADLTKIPDGIFIIDASLEKTAVTEAARMGITLFGICDTNSDPTFFDYPVPANDDGIKSIKIICETVLGAYKKGKEHSLESEAEEAAKNEVGNVEPAPEVKQEAEAIEEEIEKEVLEESERKIE